MGNMWQKIRQLLSFIKDILREVLVNLLADWLKSLLCVLVSALVSAGFFLALKRFLHTQVTIRTSVGVLLVMAILICVAYFLARYVASNRKERHHKGFQDDDKISWKTNEEGTSVDPYCPVCREQLENPADFDQQMERLLDFAYQDELPATTLRCPQCSREYQITQVPKE
jgi:uncharacterized protein YbaR (Trm112 family)